MNHITFNLRCGFDLWWMHLNKSESILMPGFACQAGMWTSRPVDNWCIMTFWFCQKNLAEPVICYQWRGSKMLLMWQPQGKWKVISGNVTMHYLICPFSLYLYVASVENHGARRREGSTHIYFLWPGAWGLRRFCWGLRWRQGRLLFIQ